MSSNAVRIQKIILFAGVFALFFGFTPNMMQTAFADDDDDKKVYVCHNDKTLKINKSALPAHLAHGDTEGKCDKDDKDKKVYVCHNDKTLKINKSALPAHLAHGDIEGKCNDKNILKWVVKLLHKIMTGEVEWVHWDSLKDDTIPADLADGDDDTLGSLSCSEGDVVKLDNTNTWVCDNDLDTLGSLTCSDGEVAVYDGTTMTWICGTAGGAGDIEGVIAGTGLIGGGTSGTVTLDVDGSQVALLNQNNAFTGDVDVGGTLTFDEIDFGLGTSYVCPDSSGCMPGSIILENSITTSRIAPGAIILDITPKTESFDLTGAEIPPLSSDTFTVSCDSSSEQITGFGVALPNDEAPISFTSVFVDDSARDTLEIEIVNQNPEWVYDPSDPFAETPSLSISALDITIFCASITP